jgi:uncharacterized membrane protein
VPQVVAIVCSVVLVALAVFQVTLLAGVPLARFAWGGEDHYLQPQFRGYAVLTAVAALLGTFVALCGADLLRSLPALVSAIGCFVFAAAAFAGFVLTARSRSPIERRVMLPLYLVLSALFLIVAVAGHTR